MGCVEIDKKRKKLEKEKKIVREKKNSEKSNTNSSSLYEIRKEVLNRPQGIELFGSGLKLAHKDHFGYLLSKSCTFYFIIRNETPLLKDVHDRDLTEERRQMKVDHRWFLCCSEF